MSSLMRSLALFGLTVAIVCSTGCSTGNTREAERGVNEGSRGARAEMAAARTTGGVPYYQDMDEIWVGFDSISLSVEESRRKNATVLEQPISVRRQYPMTLREIARLLTSTYGISVSVTEDANEAAAASAYDPVQALASRPREDGAQSVASQAVQAVGAGTFRVTYDGTVGGLLDLVTATTGTSWELDGNAVTIRHLLSRTYHLSALPVTSTASSVISNQAQGGAAQGGGSGEGGAASATQTQQSSATAQTEVKINALDSALLAIQGMLSSKGKATLSPAANAITVTDASYVHDRIRPFVEDSNLRTSRQLIFDVRVYALDLTSHDAYGLSWDILWRNATRGLNVGISTLSDTIAPGTNQLGATIIDATSPFANSSVLVDALSTQGDLSIVTNTTISTLAGQPSTLQVGQSDTYLARVEQSVSDQSGTVQVGLEPGSLTTGYSISILPVMIDTQEILMQFQTSITELRGFGREGIGEIAIQTPQVDTRHVQQAVKVSIGETLILTGFEQNRDRVDGRGIGSSKFTALGGSRGSDRKHSMLIITLTPRVAR